MDDKTKLEIRNIVIEVLKDEKVRKYGSTPLTAFEMVTKTYLQQSGTKANRPTAGQVGRMYYNTSSSLANWDDGTKWRDAAGNIV